MLVDGCRISATLFLEGGTCRCGEDLVQVNNGWLEKAMFCPKCENVYVLKLIKVPDKKVSGAFIIQCKAGIKDRTNGKEA